MAKIREAVPAEVERVLGMYEWLFAPPGSVPPRWDAERARVAIGDAIADPTAAVSPDRVERALRPARRSAVRARARLPPKKSQ